MQSGEPFWMSEIGLGIGRATSWSGGLEREVLYWYDQLGNRYSTPEELAQQERQRAENAEQQLQNLLAKLKEQGIDTDNF